ncbi:MULTISPECIES: hypothetical protein [unclassified Streptomyces]|uniref:hypothetical protein n=1 Tax=unclassified Streptomyces TaxID=2593676 RepID=UPI0036481EFF
MPRAQFARGLQKQLNTAGVEPGFHRFQRLPSYEGFAGMCVCGFEPPEESYSSLGPVLKAVLQHWERDVFPAVDEALLAKEARLHNIGRLIGYHRLIETTEEHGTRHVGWLVAGVEGSIRVHPDGSSRFQGRWSAFTTEQGES